MLYILWHIKWFVDVTLIENVQPSKFHNRQNKLGASKKNRSLLPLFFCQTITTTSRILMKMRTPVTAFQVTSLHWQRSVSVNRAMNEKLKLNQLVYIGAEGDCLCCFNYQQHSIIHLLPFKTIKNEVYTVLAFQSANVTGPMHLREYMFSRIYVGIYLARPGHRR